MTLYLHCHDRSANDIDSTTIRKLQHKNERKLPKHRRERYPAAGPAARARCQQLVARLRFHGFAREAFKAAY